MITPNATSSNSILPGPANPQNTFQNVGAVCLNTLRLFIGRGQITQLVAFDALSPDGSRRLDYAGYFDYDHLELMASEAARLSGSARGVHFTLNPLKPEVLSRCSNQVQRAETGKLAHKEDIVCRTWLMIDFDPCRPAGISATNAEKQCAWDSMVRVCEFLKGSGLPDPIIADSGNGYHLYFRINLAPDDELPRRFLKMLSERFGSTQVSIDRNVAAASQLTKLFGTIAAKGRETVERPHRQSRLCQVPQLATIDAGILSQLLLPTHANQPETTSRSTSNRTDKRARSYLAKMPPSISGQQGHNRLYEAACRLVQGFGLSVADALPLLQEYNLRAEPSWEEADLLHKLEDAASQTDPHSRRNLLTRNFASASQAADSVHDDSFDERIQLLPGSVFPTTIPDFVPSPYSHSLPYLSLTDIERPRGRPKFDFGTYFRWLVLHAIFEQKVGPVFIPEPVFAAGIGGASPSIGWRKRVFLNRQRRLSQNALKREKRRVNRQLREVSDLLQTELDIDASAEPEELIERANALVTRRGEVSAEISGLECPGYCPLHDSGKKHDHFVLRPTINFIGTLAHFATEKGERVFQFDFDKILNNLARFGCALAALC
jgi:hypothetical protein